MGNVVGALVTAKLTSPSLENWEVYSCAVFAEMCGVAECSPCSELHLSVILLGSQSSELFPGMTAA